MSFSSRRAHHRQRRRGEILALSLLLSTGVVVFESVTGAAFAQAGGGAGDIGRGILLLLPVAALAAWLGGKLASLLSTSRAERPGVLNQAAATSLMFMLLLVPAAGAQYAINRSFDHDVLIPGQIGGGLAGQLMNGLSYALMAQIVALPLLLAALALLHRGTAEAELPLLDQPSRRTGLSRGVCATMAIAFGGYLVMPGNAMAMSATGAASATPAGGTTNPCATAPHDTFNISAINVDITLNRYGTHDPSSFMYVLNSQIPAVRAEEQSGQVSSGLQGNDAIQPLVIRAHEGDCVTVNLTNATTFGVPAGDNASGGLDHVAPENIGWNVDGEPAVNSAADVSSAVGNNTDNTAAPGQTASYTVYLDPAVGEGAHVFHSTGDDRQLQGHGLFGALIAEPQGSQFLDPHTSQPLASGWDATIQMPSGPSFREFALLFHEIGDELYRDILEKPGATCDTSENEVVTTEGCQLPFVDKFSAAYRPCSKAINYRSECFFEREETQKNAGFTPDEAQDYGSYTNGDMATPRPEAYVGDPYKIRLINAGSEMGHVFHEHGGAIRWLRNPGAANPDIAGGLEKNPPVTKASIRLDSQTIEPGESYDLETECGAGGCQQVAGEFLFHCHIAAHYDAGMVGFMRVFDTAQSDLATVPGRSAKPQGVTSAGLIGKVFGGKTVVPQDQFTDPSTQISLQALVASELPPQGVRLSAQDATVWDWTWGGTADQPIALGEPEDTHVWPNYTAPDPRQRPQIMFDPGNGRYAWPLLQPHLGMRPPFSPNGHSGAPWLGENGSSTRPDGLCPSGAPLRHYNITAIQTPINDQTDAGRDSSGNPINPTTDPNGEIFVLNQNIAAVRNGTMPAQPLAVRSDVGDCIAVTLTNDLSPASSATESTDEENIFRKVNIHTHFVQFDTQASDGVITGLSYEQSMMPVSAGEPGETTLTAAAPAGATQITVASTNGLRPGIGIEIGQTLPDTEVATAITAINGNTLTLNAPLQNAHASGERTGVEFVQYRWYSDVNDGTVFFHDHVDALSSWGHGLFGAHIIEPAGSTFHDPVTGASIDSGPIADIYTTGSAGFGEKGDFREYVLWQHEGIRTPNNNLQNLPVPQGCEMSSFNLRAAPLIARDPNNADPNPKTTSTALPDGAGDYIMGNDATVPSAPVLCAPIGTSNDPYVFSSVAHGDPPTPLLKAYTGDQVVIRQVGMDEQVGDLRVTGHRFAEETWNPNGVLTDAGTAGVSEKMDYVMQGGAGSKPGDFLYYSGRSLEMESGAWGIFRVMNTLHTSGPNALEPLPDRTAPPSGTGFPTLTTTGQAPPAAAAGSRANICPSTAPLRSYNVSIFNGITFDKGQPGESDAAAGGSWAMMYALSSDEAAIKAGTKPALPLVIRANAGDCLAVTLKDDLPADNFTWTWGSGSTRAGFNIGNVLFDPQQSYGAAIGYNPDSTVGPGGTRTYFYYVDKELGTNLILNMGNESSWRAGGYGALIAEPAGSKYLDPFTGQSLASGVFADIFPASGSPFREYVTIFSDREPLLAHDVMPYPTGAVHTYTDYNQQSLTQQEAGNPSLWLQKSDSVRSGADPATPLFEAYAGDPVRWRVADAAGDNPISFQVSGHSFPLDHGITGAQNIEARTLLPGETFDAFLVGGAGGATDAVGDYEYNVGRQPLINSGAWGIFRVLPTGTLAPNSLLPLG